MSRVARLLRNALSAVAAAAATVVMQTFNGNALTTQSGDQLQTIQESVNF